MVKRVLVGSAMAFLWVGALAAQVRPVSVYVTSAGATSAAAQGFVFPLTGDTGDAVRDMQQAMRVLGKKYGVVVDDSPNAVAVLEYVGITGRALTIRPGQAVLPTEELMASATLVIGDFRKEFTSTSSALFGARRASLNLLILDVVRFLDANRAKIVGTP